MAKPHPTPIPDGRRDLTGQVFGRWTVLRFAEIRGPQRTAFWLCRCECGTQRMVSTAQLCRRYAASKSCGCLRMDTITKHGHSDAAKPRRTRTYRTWMGMTRRCRDANCPAFHNYGGRGIKVCQRWRESFVAFLEDMGECPSNLHSIERIDNDGDYCPENCRWATMAEQRRNSRQNLFLEYRGETLTLTDWARRLGMPKSTLFGRLKMGWSVEAALTSPVHTEFASKRRHVEDLR